MYSFYGRCSHCVPIGLRGVDGGGIAACGTEVWLGTGSQGEWNCARRQPMCLRCTEWQQVALARRALRFARVGLADAATLTGAR